MCEGVVTDVEFEVVPQPANGGASRLDVGGVRRRQIIRATRDLIASEGVGAVTIANIANVMRTSLWCGQLSLRQ